MVTSSGKYSMAGGAMPSFKDDLQEKEIWDIINYIKSLSQ